MSAVLNISAGALGKEQPLLPIEAARADTVSLDNALGLLRPEERTWPDKPVDRRVSLHSPAVMRLIQALDNLIYVHREASVTLQRYDENEPAEQVLLGEIRYGFPSPKTDLSPELDKARLPLAEVWETWWQTRPDDLRDPDGLELLRAYAWASCALNEYSGDTRQLIEKRAKVAVQTILGTYPPPKLRYPDLVEDLLRWLVRLYSPAGAAEFLLDATETTLALVPETELRYVSNPDDYDDEEWREEESQFMTWRQLTSLHRQFAPAQWTPVQEMRLYRLSRWLDEPLGLAACHQADKPIARRRPRLEELLAAHQAGGATDADVMDQLLGLREEGKYGASGFGDLEMLTRREGAALLNKYPAPAPLVERCRARVLEVELARGDTPTAASKAALSLSAVYGIASLVAVLQALGKGNFTRGWSRDNASKEAVFSHLVRCSAEKVQSGEGQCGLQKHEFKAQVTAAQIPEQRLVELAVYAPQWLAHVESALGWKGLVEGVWWVHAHTKGTDWDVDEDIRRRWKADLSQRTALTPQELLEGAVDVAWFRRVYADLGDRRWAMLASAAKYAATDAGHVRARLFTDAMLGRIKRKDLVLRIKQKRHQDAVRALGLLPLAEGDTHEADLRERYKLLQEFIRTSGQFDSQRQASEKRAALISRENLARTADYSDALAGKRLKR